MFNETLRIERIARTQGGRYYCKAENGVGVPAIKSIRVDVQCESAPSLSGSRAQAGKEEWGGVRWRRGTFVENRDFLPCYRGTSLLFLRCVLPHTTHTFLSVIPYEPATSL